ncbi:MAG TPA: 23S rRNA (adenine(2503)-C(2))-methyltransferase RlmN, partial [Bacteroidia bacterium]|nr:23S rRNA (adenine(2503)-C(2))-methyltransferase RlmN [Bacteroidia bacterium]
MTAKTNIRNLSVESLSDALLKMGEKKFRAKQIHEWLWKKSAIDFDSMTNLSAPLRDHLNSNYFIGNIKIAETQVSRDRTIKVAFQLVDDHIIEGVLIPTEKRMTACVSSQVGCSLSCKFCATGKLERKRNLDPGEIYDQVVVLSKLAKEQYDIPLSNIVFMGMGEPLLNYANVLQGIEHITGKDGLNMASKRITLSTAGISKMIKKLADDQVKFNLALSLHAANDLKRSQIMPINDSNNLEVLKEAIKYFYEKTENQITLEYIVFKNFNESISDAEELAAFAKAFPCKINLIEYNPV